jgi:hypothetical protein
MRRWHFGALTASLSGLALSLLLAGCGGGKDKDLDEDEPVKAKTAKGSGSSGSWKLVEGKNTATIKGVVRLKGGAVPEQYLKEKTAELQKAFESKPDNVQQCKAGSPQETTEQEFRIGENKQVGNVFVWIQPQPKEAFKVPENLIEEAKKHPVVIDQPHCAFQPHVAVLFPQYRDPKKPASLEKTGQILEIKNSAKMMGHNSKYNAMGGSLNPGKNQTIESGGIMKVDDIEADEKYPIEIKCNIHPWMRGYMWALDHPYATVSRSDTAPAGLKVEPNDPSFGSFEIKNVPAGVDVRLYAWHEKGGGTWLKKGEPLTIKEGVNTIPDMELEVP